MLLLSNSPWLRIALLAVFTPEFRIHISGETARRQVTAAVASSRPGLIVLDLIGRRTQMLEMLRQFHAWGIRVPVLAFGTETQERERILSSAVKGFISWCDSVEILQQAIQAVCKKKVADEHRFKTPASRKMASLHRAAALSPRSLLSQRELQVFDLVGQGCTTAQISNVLKVHISTIETYRERIKEKLSIHNSTELLQRAIRWSRIGIWQL